MCFHANGQVGFHTIEEAEGMIEQLDAADKALGNDPRAYEIRPVAVAEDFDAMPQLSFDVADETGELFSPLPGEPDDKGQSN